MIGDGGLEDSLAGVAEAAMNLCDGGGGKVAVGRWCLDRRANQRRVGSVVPCGG